MSLVVIVVDPNNNKVEIDWFLLKKIILGIIRGDQFLVLQYSSLKFLIPFSQGLPSILYYHFPFISTIHM